MADSIPGSIGTSLKLAKALDLARRGQTVAAQALLTASGGPPEDPVELHALAALVTGAGDFPRALVLWRQLLQREPGHMEARRMIAAIELWEFRPPWYRFIPAGVAALGVVLVVVVVMVALSSPTPAPKPELRAPVVSAPVTYAPMPVTPASDFHLNLNLGPASGTKKLLYKFAP
jgi:hypothetical protein